MPISGAGLALGGAAQALSNGTLNWYEQARAAKQAKQEEEARAEALNTAKLNQQELLQDLMTKRQEQAEHQQMLQRDQQAKAMLPKYLQAAAPEDKPIIQLLIDAGQTGEPGDAAKALQIWGKYLQDKQFTGMADAQAIALKSAQDAFELNKSKITQEGMDKRAEANREAADARQKLGIKAANQRQANAISAVDKRQSAKEQKISATLQPRLKQAQIVEEQGQKIMEYIDQHPDIVGPIAGRISEFDIKAGSNSKRAKDAATLRTMLKSYASLLPILHGFRGGSVTQKVFEDTLGDITRSPNVLKAAVQQQMDFAQTIKDNLNTQSAVQSASPTEYDFRDGQLVPTESGGGEEPPPEE
jgi:hypothetical protein